MADYNIPIGADTREASQAIEKLKTGFSKLGSIAKSSIIPLTAGFATLTATITKGINGYSVQEQAELKVANAIKNTGGAVGLTTNNLKDMASALQAQTKFGDEAILNAQSLLLTFTGIGKDIFPQVTEATLNLSEALGTDLDSSARLLGKALSDPVEGMTQLKRAGVVLTDEQENLIKSLDGAGQKSKAQEVLLGELEKRYGGLAKATVTGTGLFKQISNTIGDLFELIGESALPVLQVFAKQFQGLLATIGDQKNFSILQESIVSVGKGFAFFEGIVQFVGQSIANFISTISSTLVTFFEGNFSQAWENIKVGFDTQQEIWTQQKEQLNATYAEIDASLAKFSQKKLDRDKKEKELIAQNSANLLVKEKKFGQDLLDFILTTDKEKIEQRKSTFATIATLATTENKTLALIGKASAITIATIDGIVAVQKALSAFPPPFNFIASALVGVATAANVAKIAGVKVAQGGLIESSTISPIGKDTIPAMLQEGELVAPRKNFDEVVEAVARQRGFTRSDNNNQSVQEVIIGFTDNAFEIIESKLNQRQVLGV